MTVVAQVASGSGCQLQRTIDMGKLVVVVGNTGVGKTTLTKLICDHTDFIPGYEMHENRPFQALFQKDPSYAFANQVDYMVFRMEQEQFIRNTGQHGILDGGLEMDLFVFSRLFHMKGWLSEEEMNLLHRMYKSIRCCLPPPDLIINLQAPLDIITTRFQLRKRSLEIALQSDIQVLEQFLQEWLVTQPSEIIFTIDASGDDHNYTKTIPIIAKRLADLIGEWK